MKRITGYILLLAGLIGGTFFSYYSGKIIFHPTLWFLVCIILFFSGIILLYSSRKAINIKSNNRIRDLKVNGDKIIVTFENSTVKTNEYIKEVLPEYYRNGDTSFYVNAELYDALYNPNYKPRTEEINQTVIICEWKNKKFVSQAFSKDEVTMRYYIENGNFILYVDKANPQNYIIELMNSF